MSKPRSTRSRKPERRPFDEQGAPAERATPERRTQRAPIERSPDAPRLETDDLLAIANMDPAELAALMEGSVTGDRIEPGTPVEGVVTRVEQSAVLVDIGAKSEAWIDSAEVPGVKVGDQVSAFVVFAGESEVKISKQLTGAAASAFLDEAHATGIPVEGRVMTANNGGFDVRVGEARAFCPRSLISRSYVEEPSVFVGQTLLFKVIEVGEKVVLSRRAIEEEQAERFAEELWQRLVVGMDLEGTIRSVQPFGAFVDLGGVDGLVPKSELSWDQGASPSDLVNVGEPVTVRVVAVDPATKKITLSLKNPDQAPWRKVGTDYVEGGVYVGKIVRVTAFGAFVRLAEGLDGLLHRSKMGSDLSVGSAVDVRILSIDEERRRISLGLAAEGAAEAPAAEAEEVSGQVAEVMRNGVVVQLDDGRSAWLPASEVELPAGTMLAQRFRRGKRVTARVKDGTKPERLVLTTLPPSTDDWRAAAAAAKPAKKESFGTFGDLFAGLKLP
ncbi:MAG: S1 RNA-binding domain-containing protein [Alphaproteobacteria bacterium]|nr:S1 RNA-binding domain-containing protein [Alphaproteobacteria bacterium]MCB9690412.1 S1 RNA-binding domain-containing protein [Alphaproteobacteria bacterium]